MSNFDTVRGGQQDAPYQSRMPFGSGSAAPNLDGSPPSSEYRIKASPSVMLYHTPDSPDFGRTRAEVWFRSAEDAERAGFVAWNQRAD